MLKACLAVLAVSYVLSKGAISPSSQTVCLPLQTYLDDEERTKGDQGPVGPKVKIIAWPDNVFGEL
eukprot:m.193391 g.193391  ORF g.193391 m.193391 type:complete len:66 (+) comp39477_c0_seq37:103-300(+)